MGRFPIWIFCFTRVRVSDHTDEAVNKIPSGFFCCPCIFRGPCIPWLWASFLVHSPDSWIQVLKLSVPTNPKLSLLDKANLVQGNYELKQKTNAVNHPRVICWLKEKENSWGKKISKENFSIEFLADETDIMSCCGHPFWAGDKEEWALKKIWGTLFLSLEEFSFTFLL